MLLDALISLVLVVPLCTTISVMDRKKMAPCKFNPLCLCSKGDDLGAVECADVEMGDIPQDLVESSVFALALSGNSLRVLQEDRFRNMGCYSVEISRNQLTSIPQAAFSGLERSVWRLILSGNHFTEVPYLSIQRLNKIIHLDLADNDICALEDEQIQTLAPSLKSIILAGNSISSVPEGIFENLPNLETLDLSRNMIINIHSQAFSSGLPKLANLYLSDNLLSKIPFSAIEDVETLKILDLSENRIEEIEDSFSKTIMKLDRLLLKDNSIKALRKDAFRNFKWLNFTSLQGNRIDIIEGDAFSQSEIRHLELDNCEIGSILPGAFRGLERSLHDLNLGNNRLTVLPHGILEDFETLKKLDLSNNVLAISPNNTLSDSRYSLVELNLAGDHMRHINNKEIGLLRNLHHLSLPSLHNYGALSHDMFLDFPPGLEIVNLVNAEIKYIRNNAFYHVPSVSNLDLSGNRIQTIDENAFKEIGNSLLTLRMRHALHLEDLPNRPFHDLVSLVTLDLSDNFLETIPLDTLHKMKNLRELYLQDNEIKSFKHGTLHSQANPNLVVLDLSFNHLSEIDYDMFRFEKLEILLLNDNRIKSLDRRSFVEMKSLKHLNLEGNQINKLEDESFQNLHSLQTLNLAYNDLRSLNFDSFDYVGSLTTLGLDVSHNKIQTLSSNRSSKYATNSRIRSLDLSFNNISSISPGYFAPLGSMLKTLSLANNKLDNITKDTIGDLRKLIILDLSNNLIENIGEDTFMQMKDLQRLHLQNNNIQTLPMHTLRARRRLQILDLSGNSLYSLPENIFMDTALETLRASRNMLDEIPVKALNPVQSTLRNLDLSFNNISIISESQLSQIRNLVVLDLSNNGIMEIDDRAFCCLPSLVTLSLADNPLQTFEDNLLEGVEPHIQSLDLSNTSLTLLPTLNLPELIRLNMSRNKLTFVPSSSLEAMNKIRTLDLSMNSMPSPPHNVWFILPSLSYLSLADNPITNLKNDSFMSLDRLETLDISGLDIDSVENGTFSSLQNLKHLKISVTDTSLTDLGSLLSLNSGLHHLELHTNGASVKNHLTSGGSHLPEKLREVTVVSQAVTNLHPAAFKNINSRNLKLNLVGENIKVERDLFLNLGHTQNLTLDVSGALSNGSRKSVSVSNPSSTYRVGTTHSVFLEDLELGDKHFPCKCDSIGWLGKWLRRWRGEMCGPPHLLEHGVHGACVERVRKLRSARCANSGDLLLERMRRMGCLSYSSVSRVIASIYLPVILLFVVLSS